MLETNLLGIIMKKPSTSIGYVCGPGQFLQQKQCKYCPVGTYQFITNSHPTKCLTCPPFTYNGKTGASICQICENVTMSTVPVWGSVDVKTACGSSIVRVSSKINHVFAYLGRRMKLKCNEEQHILPRFVSYTR